MSIVVTTPTGNIGRALTRRLLKEKRMVTIITRNLDKVQEFAKNGAMVIQGSHDDPKVVTQATEGAKALFWITPPDMTAKNIRSHYKRFGKAAAAAIKANKIPYVVHLSSMGAELDRGTGPILGLHDNEGILAEASSKIIHLRPGYFMENTLWQMGNIKDNGRLYTTFDGDSPIPMIATCDIARRAAELLLDTSWRGKKVVELQGPGEICYNDVAKALTEVLGRSVKHETVTPEQAREAMVAMGLSEHVAESFGQMTKTMGSGKMKFHEKRDNHNTTPTNYLMFAKDTFLPKYTA